MTAMFMLSPTLNTTTQRIVSTMMLPTTSTSLNSSPPAEEIRTSATSEGNMPVVSNSSAKTTMPMVTMVIGRHLGGSTTSIFSDGATCDPRDMMTSTQISKRAKIPTVATSSSQSVDSWARDE